MDLPGVAPGSSACGADASSCWTISPCLLSGSREDSNSPSRIRATLSSKQCPHPGRMTSVVLELRELESNQRPPGSEPGVTTNSNAPYPVKRSRRMNLLATTHMLRVIGSQVVFQAAGAGIEPADSWFKARHHYQQRRPRNVIYRGTGGTRTRALVLNRHLLCR